MTLMRDQLKNDNPGTGLPYNDKKKTLLGIFMLSKVTESNVSKNDKSDKCGIIAGSCSPNNILSEGANDATLSSP